VKAELSRMFCDCERLDGEPDRLNRFALEIADAEERKWALEFKTWKRNAFLAEWYRYRSEVLFAASGRPSIIVDCHAFPSEVAPDVDICLGFNEDSSKPREQTIESVANIFRNAGYSVALNRPYANALAPTEYIGHSLMIEVNKRTYMNETTLEKTEGFDILRSVIKQVYQELLWNLYHLPECFRSWSGYDLFAETEEEKKKSWERIKRRIVEYTAERYGLAMPEDLSDTAELDKSRKKFKNDGYDHPVWYYWGYWNGLTRHMLRDVFGRVGVTLPESAFIRGWESGVDRKFNEEYWDGTSWKLKL